jgi:hypothetical protein
VEGAVAPQAPDGREGGGPFGRLVATQ